MDQLADEVSDQETATSHRNPAIGVLILLAVSLLYAFSLGTCMSVLSNIQGYRYEFLFFVLPIAVFFPMLVTLGFALTIPLLWIPNVMTRSVLAVFFPLLIWVAALIGMLVIAEDSGMDLEGCREVTSILILGVIGALVPVGFVMWSFQWRLRAPGYSAPPTPIGIIDLLLLTALGAGIFAFLRQSGPYSDDGVSIGMLLLISVFYGMLGAVSSLSALLAMRVMLGADRHPFRRANLVGIGLTIGMVIAVWTLPIMTDGSPVGSPWVMLGVLSVVTWSIAALTAFIICWWLRRYQFVLTNTAIEKTLQREQAEP